MRLEQRYPPVGVSRYLTFPSRSFVFNLTSSRFSRGAKQSQCRQSTSISTLSLSSASCSWEQRTPPLSLFPSCPRHPTLRSATASKHAPSSPTGCPISSATPTASAPSKSSAVRRAPNPARSGSSSSRPAHPRAPPSYPCRPRASIGT